MPTLVDCPQSSRGEWSFHLFGVAVHVKFWFWITLLLVCGEREPGETIIWIAVCFVSILLHEFGHVFAFRFFGVDAEAILYGFGGLAVPRRDVRGTFPRFVVALAGPAAGFCLAALALAAASMSGATVHFGWRLFLPVLSAWPDGAGESALQLRSTYLWYVLLNDLLFVNFYWGLVNLLPVYPLDGGHAARAVLEQRNPDRGRRNSLILSILVAVSVALFGLAEHSIYIAMMFGILAFSSVQALDAVRRRSILPGDRSWRG